MLIFNKFLFKKKVLISPFVVLNVHIILLAVYCSKSRGHNYCFRRPNFYRLA